MAVVVEEEGGGIPLADLMCVIPRFRELLGEGCHGLRDACTGQICVVVDVDVDGQTAGQEGTPRRRAHAMCIGSLQVDPLRKECVQIGRRRCL